RNALRVHTGRTGIDGTDARFGSQGDDGEAGRRRESPRQWDCSPRGHGTGGTPSVVTAAREGGADDPCELERFGDVREGPQRSGLLRESGVGPCRHDDDRERGTQSEDSLEDLYAIHSRKRWPRAVRTDEPQRCWRLNREPQAGWPISTPSSLSRDSGGACTPAPSKQWRLASVPLQ